MDRRGIISAGTWLVDNVKIIGQYPARGNLTTITRVETGLGGCSHNVLADLAGLGLGAALPLYAGGCIGRDAFGSYIEREIERLGIDAGNMLPLADAATSYTDVMSEYDGGSRTFFHFRGANARLSAEHILQMESPARIFHLGYLLLLDELDKPDPQHGVVAARVLKELQANGYETSVDVVSEEGGRFRSIVEPCLPHIDYFIVNEIEAGAVCSTQLRSPEGVLLRNRVEAAAEMLMHRGIGRLCAIHFPEGGYALTREGDTCWCDAIPVAAKAIVSSVGAGDAFCAGMLYAQHERMPLRDALRLANASARFNLFSATSTGGAPTLEQLTEFIRLNYQTQ